MLVHAAGESGALYQDPYDGRFRHAIAVVLEAKNEKALYSVEQELRDHNIQYVAIFENDNEWGGQFMAIGLVPVERNKVADVLSEYQTLKMLDNPSGSE